MVVFYISTMLGASWPLDVQMATTLGFTLFWLTTMLPFVIAIVPALVGAVARSGFRGGFTPSSFGWSVPSRGTMLIDSLGLAVVFGVIFSLLMFTPFGDLMFSKITVPIDPFWLKALTLVVSVSMVAFGPFVGSIAEAGERRTP